MRTRSLAEIQLKLKTRGAKYVRRILNKILTLALRPGDCFQLIALHLFAGVMCGAIKASHCGCDLSQEHSLLL